MMDRHHNTSSEYPLSGDRKVINVYAHGGTSIAGRDLNTSARYDQHFDSQLSHDVSIEHYSSRQHYGGAGDFKDSIGNLKRSDTDTLKPG